MWPHLSSTTSDPAEKDWKRRCSRGGGGPREEVLKRRRGRSSYLASWPEPCVCPAMVSMMASCEYMLMGVLYCAWMMVALPPGPFTSMGLWEERAESKVLTSVTDRQGRDSGRKSVRGRVCDECGVYVIEDLMLTANNQPVSLSCNKKHFQTATTAKMSTLAFYCRVAKNMKMNKETRPKPHFEHKH